MSTHGDVIDCPRCRTKNLSFNYDTKSFFQDGTCLKCGYKFWTAERVLSEEELIDFRKDYGEYSDLTDEEKEKCAKYDQEWGLKKE